MFSSFTSISLSQSSIHLKDRLLSRRVLLNISDESTFVCSAELRDPMAWHKKYLMVFLVILLNAKIFGFDPGERDSTSLVTGLTHDADEESTSVTDTHLSATEASESSTTTPHVESVTTVFKSESITTTAQPESTTTITQPQSSTSIIGSESSMTDLQSTPVAIISQSRSTTAIPHLKSTTVLSLSEPSTTTSQFESGTTITRSESNTTIPQTEETTRAMQDLRRLYTHNDCQYMKVNENGTVSFSHDRSFSISMPECSIPAYFDSYAVLEDLSLYKSLTLTTADTGPCMWRPREFKRYTKRGKYIHHYVRDGQVTFSSDDTPFVNNSGPVNSNTPAFCFLLRSPTYTDLLVDVRLVQDGDELVQGVETELYFEIGGMHYSSIRDLSKYSAGFQKRRASNALLVVAKGLHGAFQQHLRRLTISFRAEPRCTKPALEVKYPVNTTTGWVLLSGALSDSLILSCSCTLKMFQQIEDAIRRLKQSHSPYQ